MRREGAVFRTRGSGFRGGGTGEGDGAGVCGLRGNEGGRRRGRPGEVIIARQDNGTKSVLSPGAVLPCNQRCGASLRRSAMLPRYNPGELSASPRSCKPASQYNAAAAAPLRGVAGPQAVRQPAMLHRSGPASADPRRPCGGGRCRCYGAAGAVVQQPLRAPTESYRCSASGHVLCRGSAGQASSSQPVSMRNRPTRCAVTT